MPIRNHFPKFHRLKAGAYEYVWTDKCEQLLPSHYKARCLDYMTRDPPAVHWIPDTRKYTIDKHGTRLPVQNHPILVQYPIQCNKGLWAGEGTVSCWMRFVRGQSQTAMNVTRCARFYPPCITDRVIYSEILDQWLKIPCTNRAMDQIDDAFGLDYYILKTHERDLNSKLAMDMRRAMLLALCDMSVSLDLSEDRHKVYNRYKHFQIPRKEAEWVGLSIKEALEKREAIIAGTVKPPLKYLIKAHLEEKQQLMGTTDGTAEVEEERSIMPESTGGSKPTFKDEFKSWFTSPKGKGQKGEARK